MSMKLTTQQLAALADSLRSWINAEVGSFYTSIKPAVLEVVQRLEDDQATRSDLIIASWSYRLCYSRPERGTRDKAIYLAAHDKLYSDENAFNRLPHDKFMIEFVKFFKPEVPEVPTTNKYTATVGENGQYVKCHRCKGDLQTVLIKGKNITACETCGEVQD